VAKRTMTMKACTKCKEHKPLERFSKNRSAKDGLQAWCKECNKAYNASRTGRKDVDLRPTCVEELMRHTTVLDMSADDSPIWYTQEEDLTQEQEEALPGILLAHLEGRTEDAVFLESHVCATKEDVIKLQRDMLFVLYSHIRYSNAHEEILQDLREKALSQFMK